MASKAAPPPSAQSFGLNMVGVVGVLIALYVLRERHQDGLNAVLILCAAGVVPIILFDVFGLRVHRRASTGIDWDKTPTTDLKRVATKLLGLGLTVGLIALAYWAFPEYRFMGNANDFYHPLYNVLGRFWMPLVVSAVVYVWIVDGYMRDPYDAYWQLGRVVLLHPSDAKKADVANHFRGWLVKAFYIPLFIVYGQNQLNGLLHFNLDTIQASNLRLYDFLNDLVYGLDVLFAMVGYLLSFRVIDSHVRTAEPTMLGWCVALECYDPFWRGMFQRQYLHYEGIGFGSWLQDHHTLRWCWVGAILSCDLVYVLATFAFGVRFSNLTHRGILTNGPYRFSKHPAYIAKNISWWLITLPCIPMGVLSAHSVTEAIRNSLLLGGVNMIYFLRAKTEERHLSRDPTYVEYALWMNDHGVLAFLGRWFPLLKYKPPASYQPATPAQKPSSPAEGVAAAPAPEAGGA
jgi:protein-S-isoprenylcysteine O-methyltransferase Ste14